jgi:hypothetical protein
MRPGPRKDSPQVCVFSCVASPKASGAPNLRPKEGQRTLPKALTAPIWHLPCRFYVQPGCTADLVPQNLTFRLQPFFKPLLNPLTNRPAAAHRRPRTPSPDLPASPHQASRKASPDFSETLTWQGSAVALTFLTRVQGCLLLLLSSIHPARPSDNHHPHPPAGIPLRETVRTRPRRRKILFFTKAY